MLEYQVPEEHHIRLVQDPARLFTLSIGILGDIAACICRDETGEEGLTEMRENLLFSARFFDSYLDSKLNEAIDPYLILLGSASYYLCNLPGSGSVLAKRIGPDCPNMEGEGLEDLLLWLLRADLGIYFEESNGVFGKYIDKISQMLIRYFQYGFGEQIIINLANNLRKIAYEVGSPRQLLFSDIIVAVIKTKINNSAWKSLPIYSGLSRVKWRTALQKETSIKELWPAQHLLGKYGVFKGESAVVQMPTSAGKTKATELILRSAFLGERTSLAVIVAPFRALCHEIKHSLAKSFQGELTKVDELSDALQTDFEISKLIGHQQILVITPEKLLYVLRHSPELAVHIGLLIFDEGHQFDNGARGITYELLLTSLRATIPDAAQKVLISAVISNAEAIGEWLNGTPKTVNGRTLLPTQRSVAFASFEDLRGTKIKIGWMKYVNLDAPHKLDYFVPQVIEKHQLERKKGESLTKPKYFPNFDDGKEIALFLGLKLAAGGAVAIFCGRKVTASSLCELATEKISRSLPLALPLEYSDQREVISLKNLLAANLGSDASATKSADHGIFAHHGNIPHGIRVGVEHAMRENLIRLVICTSTLAQGVNLPIRYLIVTSVYQGEERIKVRDFHNLIGRAGRAGMHTEGSVLFADPNIYDKRTDRQDHWRWDQVKELLEPENSEPCISNLISIFEPFESDDRKYYIEMEALSFVNAYIHGPDAVLKMASDIVKKYGHTGFSLKGVERQILWRTSLVCAVESFLLSHWDETPEGLLDADVIRLAERTLAYSLADDPKKEHIRKLFQLLATNISSTIPDPNRRKVYGRTMFGIRDSQTIEEWVQTHATDLIQTVTVEDFLYLVWPLIINQVQSGPLHKFDKPEVLLEIAHEWINGKSFGYLFEIIGLREAKMIWGSRRRDFKIDHVVEVCEGTIAYDGALLVSAICEFIELSNHDESGDLIARLQLFQKRLKYGLPSETTIRLFELGFSDRVIAQDLSASLNLGSTPGNKIIKKLKQNRDDAMDVMAKYPKYFQERMNELLS